MMYEGWEGCRPGGQSGYCQLFNFDREAIRPIRGQHGTEYKIQLCGDREIQATCKVGSKDTKGISRI